MQPYLCIMLHSITVHLLYSINNINVPMQHIVQYLYILCISTRDSDWTVLHNYQLGSAVLYPITNCTYHIEQKKQTKTIWFSSPWQNCPRYSCNTVLYAITNCTYPTEPKKPTIPTETISYSSPCSTCTHFSCNAVLQAINAVFRGDGWDMNELPTVFSLEQFSERQIRLDDSSLEADPTAL
jgi:hypothetical protein